MQFLLNTVVLILLIATQALSGRPTPSTMNDVNTGAIARLSNFLRNRNRKSPPTVVSSTKLKEILFKGTVTICKKFLIEVAMPLFVITTVRLHVLLLTRQLRIPNKDVQLLFDCVLKDAGLEGRGIKCYVRPTKRINAAAILRIPCPYVEVNQGLLDELKWNPLAIKAVLAHECGHILRCKQIISQKYSIFTSCKYIIMGANGMLTEDSWIIASIILTLLRDIVEKMLSRHEEFVADKKAVELYGVKAMLPIDAMSLNIFQRFLVYRRVKPVSTFLILLALSYGVATLLYSQEKFTFPSIIFSVIVSAAISTTIQVEARKFCRSTCGLECDQNILSTHPEDKERIERMFIEQARIDRRRFDEAKKAIISRWSPFTTGGKY